MVQVIAIGASTGTRRLTATDDEGRYGFANLPPDDYRIGVSRPPFLAQIVGTRRPGASGTPIRIAAGAHVAAPEVRLTRGGAIEGTVYHAHGVPSLGASVSAAAVRVRRGVRVLLPVAHMSVTTDRHGRYRVHGLMPGTYVISAAPGRNMLPVAALDDAVVDRARRGEIITPTMAEALAAGPPNHVSPTYAPGTIDPGQAVTVTILDGTDVAGVDLQFRPSRSHRVQGVVVDALGQPTDASVALVGRGWPKPLSISLRGQGRGGQFAFGNIPAATYRLEARSTTSDAVAFVDLTLDGIDHENMIVTLRPPLTLSGRLDAPNISSLPQTFVVRSMIDDRDTTVFLRADGSFTSPALAPGTYVLVAPGLTHARIGASDITDRLFDVTEPIADIAITVGDQVQTLDGRITDDSGIGIGGSTLVLFSTAEAHWHDRSRRVEAVDADIEGRFRFGGPGDAILPAGDYFLAAVSRLLPDEQYDPAFLRSLIPSAIRLSLAPGQRLTQDLKVR
jgi:hypothetical protein